MAFSRAASSSAGTFCALLVAAWATLAGVPAAHAVEAVNVRNDAAAIDLTDAVEFRHADGDRIQVSTAPGPDGIIRRIEVRAREADSNWAVFALANDGDEQIDRLIVAPHYRMVGSGLIWPDLGQSRIVYITPSSGDPPERQENPSAVVDDCCEYLKPHLDRDLRELLYPQPGDEQTARTSLQDTFFTQPSIFVIEYALARFWQSLGIEPATMAGHSIGEFVAATLAGVWKLEDALSLIALRGRLMQNLPRGSMMAVSGSAESIAKILPATLQIGSNNAPALCVVSGPEADVLQFQKRLEAENLGAEKTVCRLLHTSHAFHSAMMDPMVEPLREAVAKIQLHAPSKPFVSSVTGPPLPPRKPPIPHTGPIMPGPPWSFRRRSNISRNRDTTSLLNVGRVPRCARWLASIGLESNEKVFISLCFTLVYLVKSDTRVPLVRHMNDKKQTYVGNGDTMMQRITLRLPSSRLACSSRWWTRGRS